MFDIAWSEIALIGAVALVVIGPKDLPRVLRTAGQWMRQARMMANDFRSNLDDMVREADISEHTVWHPEPPPTPPPLIELPAATDDSAAADSALAPGPAANPVVADAESMPAESVAAEDPAIERPTVDPLAPYPIPTHPPLL